MHIRTLYIFLCIARMLSRIRANTIITQTPQNYWIFGHFRQFCTFDPIPVAQFIYNFELC